jgi:hypothetical protein
MHTTASFDIKKVLLISALLGVATTSFSCTKEAISLPVDPNSVIGKVDQNGVTAIVDKPNHPACSRDHVSVKLDTFEHCLTQGLTYVQVANILGYKGTLSAQADGVEVWEWNGNEGVLIAKFADGRLVSKSQSGLISEE